MTTLQELEAKVASQNEQLNNLSKAYDNLQKDSRMMVTGDAPVSTQIQYTPELKSKVFERAPFFRFLESKGRVDNSFNSVYAGFYIENDNSLAMWIDENEDIPAANASSYTEAMSKMKTLIHPIDVSLMAQMGNNAIDILAREIDKGFIFYEMTKDFSQEELDKLYAFDDFKQYVWSSIADRQEFLKGLTEIIDGNGGVVDCIVTTNNVAKQLKKIVAPYRRYNDKVDLGLGHRVTVYEAPNGAEIPILIDSNLNQISNKDAMLFADSSTIEVKRLLAPTLMTNLPTNKLGTKNAVVSFATANNIGEFKNGIIKGIGDGEE